MAVWSVATYNRIYKERYQNGVTTYLAEQSPFFRWFKIETDHGGDPWKIVYRTNAVRGATNIADALANRNASVYDEAQPDYAEEHVVVSVNMLAARRTARSANAMVKGVEEAVNATNEELCLTFEHKLAGNGGGARGRIAGIAGAIVTLVDASTAYLFARGMRLEACTTDGVTAGVLRVIVYEIQSIDPSLGTLTMTANVLAPWVATDFLFREGDYDAAAQRIIQGMQAWNPPAAPGAAPFFGLVRANHQGALGGTRVTQGAQHILDVIREACAVSRNNRGSPDTWWVNPLKMAEIDQAIGAKQEFEMQTDYPGIGLKGLRVSTPSGTVSVLESSAWAETQSMLTKRDTWIIGSVGECPHPVNDDGQLWHMEALSDAIQMRHRAYCQLGCTDPKHSTNITLS